MDTGQLSSHFGAGRFVGHYDDAWLPSFGLFNDHIYGRSNAKCNYFKLVGRLSNDVQRLRANRA
jgi:hypothetical protein